MEQQTEINGLLYKINPDGKVFYWNDIEWMTSTKTVEEIRNFIEMRECRENREAKRVKVSAIQIAFINNIQSAGKVSDKGLKYQAKRAYLALEKKGIAELKAGFWSLCENQPIRV